MSRDIANFCAWHAPEMRQFFIDHRLQLFDRETVLLGQLVDSFFDDFQTQKRTTNFSSRKAFRRDGIDSLVCPVNPKNLRNSARDPFLLFMAGMIPAAVNPRIELLSAYADGKTAVLCWTKALKTPMVGLAEECANWPWGGMTRPGRWTSPWLGLQLLGALFPWPVTTSAGSPKIGVVRYYFEQMGQFWSNYWLNNVGKMQPVWELAAFSMPNNLSIGPLPLLLTTCDARLKFKHDRKEHQDFASKHLGGQIPAPLSGVPDPFELPIWLHQLMFLDQGPLRRLLSLQAARKAITDDPQDPASQYMFGFALSNLNQRQESYWANTAYPYFQQNASLRSNLRKYQFVAALHAMPSLSHATPKFTWNFTITSTTRIAWIWLWSICSCGASTSIPLNSISNKKLTSKKNWAKPRKCSKRRSISASKSAGQNPGER